MSTFRCIRLKYENYSLRDIQTIIRPQMLRCKKFRWKCIKNESRKSYLGDKEQKAMYPVVSRSDTHLTSNFFCS